MPKYIDRDKIMLAGVPVSRDEDGECYVRLSDVRRAIMQVPVESTADAQEVKRSKWIKEVRVRKDDKPMLYRYKCSLCGVFLAMPANFCPNCGAKMDGDNR